MPMQIQDAGVIFFGPQPSEEYHASPGISRSMLATYADRKKKAWGYWFAPEVMRRKQPEATPAMKFGTLVHEIVFEPEFLPQNHVVFPAKDWTKTKKIRAKARPLAKAHPGKEIWHPDDWARAACCAHAVASMPRLAELLTLPSKREHSIHWTDEATGLRLRCRPDWLLDAGDTMICIDLKTCQDASPDGFRRSVRNWRYDLQAAHYSEGVRVATGKPVRWFFLAVESAFPHCAALHCIRDTWDAECSWAAVLKQLKYSIENDDWSEDFEKQTNIL